MKDFLQWSIPIRDRSKKILSQYHLNLIPYLNFTIVYYEVTTKQRNTGRKIEKRKALSPSETNLRSEEEGSF